ncbi:MAG: hypothetical protein IAG13_24425 [Deltaproteobacteria bacterium]|nr:hypothetical protein [Nannocystaceae bacterium]
MLTSLGWACIVSCAPASGDDARSTDSEEGSSGAVDDSTGTGDEPAVMFPTRLLMLRDTLEGGKALEFVELEEGDDLTPRALHPELDPSTVVEEYAVLRGTELVAFRARPSDSELSRLYVAQAEIGAPGSAIEIGVDGDVTELAWLHGARTLVVATSSTTYRVEMTATAPTTPVELPGPSAPADLGIVDAEGMRIAADFSAAGDPYTCFVASADPAAPTAWLDAHPGAAADCSVSGFGPDAVVLAIGELPPLSLLRRRFVDGQLRDAVELAGDAATQVHVGPHGVIYRTDGSTRELFYIATEADEIGVPQRLSTEGVDIQFQVSEDRRHLAFSEGSAAKLVDLDRPDVFAVSLRLPSPYDANASLFAVSPDLGHAFVLGHRGDGEYWEELTSLWRFDISNGIATDPLQITETAPSNPEANSSSIEALDVAPEGDAIAYARNTGRTSPGGDVSSTELGPRGATETSILADDSTRRLSYSADGSWLASGEVHVHTRAGEEIVNMRALEWTWWELIE